ncbi:MAG TPA: molybdenum cofactor biosynthesis protein MoaE [Bacteroidota bacterium]|nr:molybdenum cofactor biosynthesis protein MoaE [Bacteroidota bacterium]
MIQIIRDKININALLAAVADPAAGGIDIFIGTTRNHSDGKDVLELEYEAYQDMALPMMRQIADDAKERWGVMKIAVVHRIGKVPVGEASVAIAVSSAHRKEAFEACRYIIDTLKKTVPIWKKELFADGSKWVGERP